MNITSAGRSTAAMNDQSSSIELSTDRWKRSASRFCAEEKGDSAWQARGLETKRTGDSMFQFWRRPLTMQRDV